MAEDISDEYMCYNTACRKTSGNPNEILEHTIFNHHSAEQFRIRKKILDPNSGYGGYQSIHFGIEISELAKRVNDGFKPRLDIINNKISFKRPSQTISSSSSTATTSFNVFDDKKQSKEVQTIDNEVYQFIPGAIEKLKEMGRLDDFISVLNAIATGKIVENIALHLLLDVGSFLSKPTIFNTRYSDQTIAFWITVKKLFKGKGVNFFRGFKGEGTKSVLPIKPEECRINFAVPSDSVLLNESQKYTADAGTPGILKSALDSYAKSYPGKEVKLSIDGKKLASGLGSLGDEDLCGYETSPTLEDRKLRLSSEMNDIEQAKEKASEYNENEQENLNKKSLKEAILIVIGHLSNRIRDLRLMMVEKQVSLNNLLKHVEGDWKQSKLAPAISFYKTKLVHCRTTIHDLLSTVDKLGYSVACINGTHKNYTIGQKQKIQLSLQENYSCLRDLDMDLVIDSTNSKFIKQRTERWKVLREGARITGSSIFRGIGLNTLKAQQEHFDKVYQGKELPVTPELQALFDYGSTQEINAVATLVGKIIPVYYPELSFLEDGCEMVPLGNSYAVISGDGTGIDSENHAVMAFEFKCPKPNKERTTDVHYDLPIYYTTQVLSQKSCRRFAYLSFTPDSCTLIEGEMNNDVWDAVWNAVCDVYSADNPKRPSRNSPEKSTLLEKLKEFANTCIFRAEFPSLFGIPCSCSSVSDIDNVFGSHLSLGGVSDESLYTSENMTLELHSSLQVLKESYEILRKPAKEILLTVLSDLDRMSSDECSTYAVPIQYALPGYSLRMENVRKLLNETIRECFKRNLEVKAVAFDGQFLELSVSDDNDRPLTVCRLMKLVWETVQKTDRNEKLQTLLNQNKCPPVLTKDDLYNCFEVSEEMSPRGRIFCLKYKGNISIVGSCQNIAKAIESTKQKTKPQSANETPEKNDLDILQYIPREVISEMDESAVEIVRSLGKCKETTDNDDDGNEPNPTADHEESFRPTEVDIESALISLIASKPDGTSKWDFVSLDTFKSYLSHVDLTRSHFTVAELITILSLSQEASKIAKKLKPELVNMVSSIYGDGSTVPTAKCHVKSLKCLVEIHIKKWPIHAINVAYAQLIFGDKLNEWEVGNPFNGACNVVTDTGKAFHVSRWYAQPIRIYGNLVQPIIDPHHIFVNNRSACCSKGMLGMGIQKEAWLKVAEDSKTNGTGLSLEIAKELRDRQKNAFAQITFSEEVEKEMLKNNDHQEAQWCRLIRHWYHAIDEAALSIDQRIEWLLDMRENLLSFLHVGHFPPPGSFVASMTIAQFEGIVGNIDRRLQLFSMTKANSYNQRAITSLDSETFFSAFQDYDPKGSGVLRPDDIPTALGSALCLFNQRISSDRIFHMKTSRKARVYQEHLLSRDTESGEEVHQQNNVDKIDGNGVINARSHPFDLERSKKRKPKRKSGKISSFGMPGRGAQGARQHHRTDEEKILSHKRFGLKDEEVD